MQLTPTQLQLITNILKSRLPQENKAFLFGSRAKNSAREFSDVDICISGSPLDLKTMAQLKEQFSESDLPYFVDIVLEEKISPEFRTLIKNEMIEISLLWQIW